MTLQNIPLDLQNLLILDYEYRVKTILFVGWWIFSLFYLLYWYKRQDPTKIFLLGTFRASMYATSWLYTWLFWLIYPIYLHPNVAIDNLLLFLAYSYTGIVTIFFVMFVFNFTLWVPRFVINFGKIDLSTFEDTAFTNYFGKSKKDKWFKRK